MLTFVRYSANLFVRPRVTLRAMLIDPRRVTFGFLGLITLTAIYLLNISVLIAKGLHPTEPLVLRIPREQYYVYELFFLLPVVIGGAILQAGVARLLARWWGGQSCFEDLFALFGLNHIVLAIVMGLPDLAIYILAPDIRGGLGPHILVGTLWYFLLTILSVKEAERISWSQSIVVAIASFLASGMLSFTYIR